jgi:DNA-binding response OmpR family regulator
VSVAAVEVWAVDPPGGEGAGLESGQRPRLAVAWPAGRRDPTMPVRVLLVEDEPSMRTLCAFNLELAGFDVTTAGTGAEGLARAVQGGFDLVLLDVMLPDLGGFEVAGRLREEAAEAAPPVVFLSARGSGEDLARGRAAGGIDYVVKPFDPVALPRRLREDLDELEHAGAEALRRRRFGPTAGS